MTASAPDPLSLTLRRRRIRLQSGFLALALIGLVLAPACGGGGRPAAGPQPLVQSFDRPSQYPGQTVTLVGSGFTGTDQVTFGTVQARFVTVVDDGHITVTVPDGVASGPAAVTVRTPNGAFTTSILLNVLALPAAPVVGSFTPPSAAPGTRVTLTGTGFTTASAVQFGGVAADPATIQVTGDTTLAVLVPAGAAAGPCLVSVTSPGGTGSSNGDFTVTLAPTLASIQPMTGAPGTQVVLTGTGFNGLTQVLFTGDPAGTAATVAAQVQASSATQIAVNVPAGAGTGFITVETAGGAVSSAPNPFTVLATAMTVSTFSPNSGPEGTPVSILGANLGNATGVTFGGVPAAASGITLSGGGAALTVIVPPGGLTGPVQLLTTGAPVTVPGGSFTVQSPAVSATGFTLSAGAGVQTVTIAGANLNLATGVGFTGGVSSSAVTVSADGTSLTCVLPAGVLAGPISVLTAGGPLPVPGGNLILPAGVPAIASFAPAQGVPGTEVTLAGSGFTGISQVTYAGLALDASRYDVDSDAQIRVRVPDDAQAGGAIGVQTPASGLVETAVFVLVPSRRTILPQPLVASDGAYGLGTWLDFPTRRRAAMYGPLQIPQAPVFHAYNPDGQADGGVDANRPGHILTRFSLELQLGSAFYALLPADLSHQIQALGVPSANVDIFVVSQDYQYDGVTPLAGVYLFRPHYWTDPAAPVVGAYYVNHNLSGAIYQADPGVTISGNAPGVLFDFSILTHGPVPPAVGDIVASGNTEPMAGFDPAVSTGLWSLVVEPATGRAAATLHLLFNDADQMALDDLTDNPGTTTVQALLAGLALPPFNASRGVQMLLGLGRPVVDAVTPNPVAGTANTVLTLTGTGLSGATGVTVNGAAVAAFQAVSDAIVTVTVPAGTAGNIQVAGPFGSSDPVAVP